MIIIELEKIKPKQHLTWYKIYFLQKLLEAEEKKEKNMRSSYVFWIDADALVIRQDVELGKILEMGKYKNLIIAEDTHTGNLLNAGVFAVRVCDWSKQFLEKVVFVNILLYVSIYKTNDMK